jgi:hypothetical protein
MLFFLALYVALAACVAMMAMIRGRPGRAWFLRALFFTPFVCGPLVVALPREGGAFLAADELEEESWKDLEAEPADCTIRVVRRDAVADQTKSCDIYINGNRVGAIEPRGVADFRVPHGTVLVEAKNNWGRSRPLRIKIAAGDRVDVELSNLFGRGLVGFWKRLFGSDDQLSLRQLPAIDRAAA